MSPSDVVLWIVVAAIAYGTVLTAAVGTFALWVAIRDYRAERAVTKREGP